jgi:two-component system, cell cycle sensor histidine kinase and response regulator CckA
MAHQSRPANFTAKPLPLFLSGIAAASLCWAALFPISAAASEIALTPEETTFLQKHPVWRITGESTPPFQWLDKNKKFQGIAADYCAIIRARLNIQWQIVPADSWTASLEGMRRGACDISMLTARTPEREAYLIFTKPLLDLPPAIITRSDDRKIHGIADLAGRRVVVARSYAVHEQMAQDHPEILLLPRDDEGSAISAVALGDAEAYVGDLASATDAIERLGVRDLKVAGQLPYRFPFRIAVRRDWPEAVSVLDKVIDSITTGEQNAIDNKWLALQGVGFSLRRVLTMALPITVAAVIATLFLANRRLGRVVTQQRRTAAALWASEERWSFALEGARDGVWDWDVVSDVVFFSKQWKAMLGYAEEELPNEFEEWSKRVHPDDLEAAFDAVQRHLRGDTPGYELEHRMATRDGSYRWILARGRVVARDPAGKPLRMVGTHTDITERKHSEEHLEETIRARTRELQLAEQRLREVTDRLPGAVYQLMLKLDGSFIFTFCSEGFEEMTGVRAEDAVRDVNSVWANIQSR